MLAVAPIFNPPNSAVADMLAANLARAARLRARAAVASIEFCTMFLNIVPKDSAMLDVAEPAPPTKALKYAPTA